LIKDGSVLEARYILGNILLKQNKYDEAIKEFKTALEFDPDYYAAIFGLASAYKKAKKTDEAILGFKRLVEMDSKDTKPLLHLGNIYEMRDDLDKALRYLKSGASIDPESPVFHNKMGAVYLKKNELALAEKEIKMALSIERSVPLINAHFNMALVHEARGEFDLAIREYKEEQKTSPFNYKPDFNLGLLYSKSKELDKAIQEFKSCVEKNEEYADAYIFLAKVYMDSEKDLREAEMYAQKGLGFNPALETTIFAHFVLADIYNRLGRLQEAGQHVRKARELKKKLSQ
jgi:tetratricopeptide (TPR) repeat protein